MLMLCVTSASAQQDIDRIVAVIGDKIVLHSDVMSQMQQAQAEGMEIGPTAYCTILEEILFQKLLTYQAELDSIIVKDEEVEADMNNRFNYFIQQGGGSREEFERHFGKSVEQMKDEFREPTRERLLANRMQQQITSDITITPAEVKKFYRSIPEDSLPFMGSQIEYAQIAIIPQVTQAEKEYLKEKLKKIRKEIISGETSFCTAATFFSCDPGTNGKCGEFDFVTRGTFVPQFDAMAFSMKEGEISDIFETMYGFHILQLLERRGDMYRGRHILLCLKPSETSLQSASKQLDSVYTAITTGTLTFNDAVLKFSTDDVTKHNKGKAFNEYSGDSRFDVRDLDKQMFVTVDQLKPGEISRPVVYQSGANQQGVRIVKLLSRTDPHRASLEKDYPYISDAALSDKKNKAILAWVKTKMKTINVQVDGEMKNCRFEYPWSIKEN